MPVSYTHLDVYKRQLLNNPDFLIIDEPTTGLDPEERIRIRNLLVDFSKDRTCLLYTSMILLSAIPGTSFLCPYPGIFGFKIFWFGTMVLDN